jgi:hypothetical protein
MYPINVPDLVRRETLGSRAGDPTLPNRPRRRPGPVRALVWSQAALMQSGRGVVRALRNKRSIRKGCAELG